MGWCCSQSPQGYSTVTLNNMDCLCFSKPCQGAAVWIHFSLVNVFYPDSKELTLTPVGAVQEREKYFYLGINGFSVQILSPRNHLSDPLQEWGGVPCRALHLQLELSAPWACSMRLGSISQAVHHSSLLENVGIYLCTQYILVNGLGLHTVEDVKGIHMKVVIILSSPRGICPKTSRECLKP